MDTLKAMRVFVEVAKQQGFAPAAKQLGLSTSSVSRHVLNLEDRLNCQLFVRTTRNLTLTPAGNGLLEQCQRIVYDTEEFLQSTWEESTTPTGRLRVTMPEFLASLFAKDVIAQYVVEYPDVDFELVVLTRLVNMVEEDFDLAIRVGELRDSTLMARKLLDFRLALVGSPDYIERNGEPRNPQELHQHNCVIETESPYKDRWPLVHGSFRRRQRIRGNVKVNIGETARDLVVGGAGLGLFPVYQVVDQLRSGELVEVMNDYVPGYGGIYAVYPRTRYLSLAVRSFIEFLVAHTESIRDTQLSIDQC